MVATAMEVIDPTAGQPLEDSDDIRQIRESVRPCAPTTRASTGARRTANGNTRPSSCGP